MVWASVRCYIVPDDLAPGKDGEEEIMKGGGARPGHVKKQAQPGGVTLILFVILCVSISECSPKARTGLVVTGTPNMGLP